MKYRFQPKLMPVDLVGLLEQGAGAPVWPYLQRPNNAKGYETKENEADVKKEKAHRQVPIGLFQLQDGHFQILNSGASLEKPRDISLSL